VFASCLCASRAPWWTSETVAVVTGANRGIGHALAARLAEQGLAVVLTARDEARGEAAAAALRARRGLLGSVRFRRLDVADPASVAAFASWVRDELGGLDILVSSVKSRRQLRAARRVFSLSFLELYVLPALPFPFLFWFSSP
jgi:NAD(P)-dependent dehydrogenase (short-subunit alcohol dehydrogenase family)